MAPTAVPFTTGIGLAVTRLKENRMNHERSHHDAEPTPFWRSRYAVGLLVMGAIAAYFLLSEHRAHFLGA